MLYAELLKLWDESVQAMDSRDWQGALEKLQQIQEPTSRILFNAATAHLALGHLDMALKCLDLTISKDEHLAVGFFQRAAVNMQLERLEDALSDCIWAQKHMRKNTVIDYKQLGLRFKLYSWQVCHPLTHICLMIPNITEAGASAPERFQSPVVRRLSAVDSALESDRRREPPPPLTVPESLVFRPRKQEVEQLQKKDFLGKAKVKSLLLSLYSCRIMNTLTHKRFICSSVNTNACLQRLPEAASLCPQTQTAGLPRAEPSERGAWRHRAGPGCGRQSHPVVPGEFHHTKTLNPNVKPTPQRRSGQTYSVLNANADDPLVNRHVLYQMVALYNYDAQGPEDLEFSEGDTIDILSEVNEEWLEGHCAGNVGIFPSCFAYRENSSLYPSQI
uniref:NADPH oxidase activator 1 n=1 Tax=Oryzias latipes TaxID=8090 RepID=A0A3P9IT34_ORYLA